jgi:type II secretory pathway component GspD/PulD (secretin)
MRNSVLVVLCVLLPGSALQAQQPQADLEKRVSELEAAVKLLTRELQELRTQLKASTTKGDPLIIRLTHAEAAVTAKKISDLLGLKKNSTPRIVADPRTNSLVIQGTAEEIAKIKDLAALLDRPAERVRGDKVDEAQRKRLEDALRELGGLQTEEDLKARLDLAKLDVEMSEDRVAWAERMNKKGYLTATQLEADRNRLKRAQEYLAALKKELEARSKPK